MRAIPSVDRILRELGETHVPRLAVRAVVRRELAAIRSEKAAASTDQIVARVRQAVHQLHASRLRPVINGTGIVIHTNLGRSPLGPQVIQALAAIGSNYNTIEYDLSAGERGGRAAYLEHNLAVLCDAGAATVVNNGAAALVLVLRHFTAGAARKQVIISRGELVQIGGGFRIPEILEASGAQLREVGTTNKTTLADYARAAGRSTAMILKVHRSNFYMRGFVESPGPEELAALARKRKLPLVEDLGSGATVRTEQLPGVGHEPTPAEVLGRGADLVCFSGDKLLGGPQAGIVAGKPKLIAAIKRDPIFRALRCDKLILAALQTTVDLHLAGRSEEVPILAMLWQGLDDLRRRAQSMAAALQGCPARVDVSAADAQVGGGSLPEAKVPSVTLDLIPDAVPLARFAALLRTCDPPVIGFVAGRRFRIDLRTVFPGKQDEQIVRAVRTVLEMGE